MLIDTTLREGDQLYGAYFNMEARRGIVRSLIAAGVEEIEIGCIGNDQIDEFLPWVRETLSASGSPAIASAWCRLREDDLVKARALGVDRVNIGAPVSVEHLEKRLSLSRRGLFCRMERVIDRARSLGFDYISVGLEDVSRAEPNFSLEAARLAVEHGASRIRLSDTVGILSPLEMQDYVRMYKLGTKTDIAVHCHNDFGMATANAVAALESGAAFADVSVLGIGERAGIAALEEVAAFLNVRRGYDYDIACLARLAKTVGKTAKIDIPRNKAVAGRDIFSCESGLHVHGLLKDPDLYEPYSPEMVGAGRTLSSGRKSGRAGLREHLERLGVHVPAADLDRLTTAVRAEARMLERPLTDGELTQLAHKVLSTRHGGDKAA